MANHRIRFMTNNFAATGSVVTSSSAQSAYPIANLTDSYRFRTWRPAGNFTISSSNKTIYINDGSDKTVTLTEASYLPATLAAHVQTQLNASSSNWTCTYSTSTFKFTIGRSSGTANLRFGSTTDAAWDTLGYTGSTTVAASTGLAADEARNHTSEYVDIDLGTDRLIQFAALLGPLGEVFSLSSAATVTLKGNTAPSFTSPAVSVTLTPDTHGIYKFIDDTVTVSYRYWRVEFVDRKSTVGPTGFKFGHLYLGDYTTLTSRNVANGFSKQLVDSTQVQVSEGGALFGRTGIKYQTWEAVEIAYMLAADRRALEQEFYDLGNYTPFYVSFDPTLLISTSASEYTRYVILENSPKFTQVKTDTYSVVMSFREVM